MIRYFWYFIFLLTTVGLLSLVASWALLIDLAPTLG